MSTCAHVMRVQGFGHGRVSALSQQPPRCFLNKLCDRWAPNSFGMRNACSALRRWRGLALLRCSWPQSVFWGWDLVFYSGFLREHCSIFTLIWLRLVLCIYRQCRYTLIGYLPILELRRIYVRHFSRLAIISTVLSHAQQHLQIPTFSSTGKNHYR